MPKTFTLDGAPSDYYKPEPSLLKEWFAKRGISARDRKRLQRGQTTTSKRRPHKAQH